LDSLFKDHVFFVLTALSMWSDNVSETSKNISDEEQEQEPFAAAMVSL